jgi:hypothetical protein
MRCRRWGTVLVRLVLDGAGSASVVSNLWIGAARIDLAALCPRTVLWDSRWTGPRRLCSSRVVISATKTLVGGVVSVMCSNEQ